jgi:hypothetical protein
MTSVTKVQLSGSTDGRGIKVTQTASQGDTIHTAHASNLDEIWLWAHNTHASSEIVLTIEFGGTANPDDRIIQTIPKQDGFYQVVPGLPLTNSVVVRAYADTADSIVINGFVNRIG